MPTRKGGQRRASGPTEPSLPDRRLMEQQMSAITRLLAERDFASIEEANAYLREALVEGHLPTPAPATPLEEAQEVIYQALAVCRRERSNGVHNRGPLSGWGVPPLVTRDRRVAAGRTRRWIIAANGAHRLTPP